MKNLLATWNKLSLVKQIIIGLVIGIVLAVTIPDKVAFLPIFGELFVGALKAVAPILVLFLVTSAIAQHKSGQQTNMKEIIGLYLIATVCASLTAVVASFIFKVELVLPEAQSGDLTPPGGVIEVMRNLLFNLVDNPVNALTNANYIGILASAVLLGLAIKHANENTKTVLEDIANAISQIVKWVIKFAPLGVMGLVFNAISTTGISSLMDYGKIVCLLVGTMLVVALIINPIIVFINIRRNPYPLIFQTIRESGIYAFFTRSSAANIPVNMSLCEKLGLDEDTYSISIPLGATINMGGAAITIAVLTLAAAYTLGIPVSFVQAVILCLLASVSACGASGVAGGSLLLIPMACSLFGIPNDVAMQVVGVGFIVGVIQDSCETALNSSTDVLFTATAEYAKERKAEKAAK